MRRKLTKLFDLKFTSFKPADLRLNAVVKMIYRKHYKKRLLSQLWDNSERLGFSIKECIELSARIIQHEIRNVLYPFKSGKVPFEN